MFGQNGTWRKRLIGGFLITDGAPSFKQQASSLTSIKLQDIMGVEREGNMIIDRTPTEGAVRISSTINNHLVTRVYYFMTKKEAVQSFKEEFNEKENRP